MTKERYVNKKVDSIVNCPFCRGVILRDFKVDKTTGNTTFTMRCPHCQKNILLNIKKDGAIIIEQPENATEK